MMLMAPGKAPNVYMAVGIDKTPVAKMTGCKVRRDVEESTVCEGIKTYS